MKGSPDESIREEIWQKENIVIACSFHIKDWDKNPNVLAITKIRFQIECGHRNCANEGLFEIKLKQPKHIEFLSLPNVPKIMEIMQ